LNLRNLSWLRKLFMLSLRLSKHLHEFLHGSYTS